jgi:mono/diheme cytochrome c family protein
MFMRSAGPVPLVSRLVGCEENSLVRSINCINPSWIERTHGVFPNHVLRRLVPLTVVMVMGLLAGPARGELTEQQERMAGNFTTAINNASSLFKEQKFTEAAAELTRAQRILDSLSKKPSPEVLQKIGKDYRRLQKAHELLASKGVQLDPLKELTIPKVDPAAKKSTAEGEGDATAESSDSEEEEPKEERRSSRNRRAKRDKDDADADSSDADSSDGETRKRTGRRQNAKEKDKKTAKAAAGEERAAGERSDSSPVSFNQQVAPLLVQHCGKCHMDAQKGKYSLASFQTMMDTGSVIESDADGSELLQKIEAGEMPPSKDGAVSVPAEEIRLIRSWIAQGARFDGDDPDADLRKVVAAQGGESK